MRMGCCRGRGSVVLTVGYGCALAACIGMVAANVTRGWTAKGTDTGCLRWVVFRGGFSRWCSVTVTAAAKLRGSLLSKLFSAPLILRTG
ncbi:uncharacterized protein BDZ83DRAFT_196807 [Colletotrichum acutatum]|uniref:Uncharacterized protein n=1 Tax=Glomerella acutata TaxID=27357 RepID=A0AAD8XHM4_GLOAC|nr:uncharacterized protein BDZ83DRAFT_196807 [Colletotrichum acutatum]KAK1727602.1 hypothetical protein BDZ83DRAFT_196807 [Colletotrichum acutatum]